MLTLSHVASIFVPSTVNVNQAVDTSQIVNGILAQLSSQFGGASCIDVTGAWLSDSSGLVVESVKRIFCYGTDREELFVAFSSLAEEIKAELTQESVLIDIDNVGYLV